MNLSVLARRLRAPQVLTTRMRLAFLPDMYVSVENAPRNATSWHADRFIGVDVVAWHRQPDENGEEDCVEMYATGQWNDDSCYKRRQFFFVEYDA